VQASSVSLQDVSEDFSFLWISFCESQIFAISRTVKAGNFVTFFTFFNFFLKS
jgi:hypothetical protein